MLNLKNKEKTFSTLKPKNIIGIKSDKEYRLPMIVFSALMTLAALFCIIKIELESFHMLDDVPAGPYSIVFSPSETRRFYLLILAGSIIICIANGLKKHSFKVSMALFVVYAVYFGRHYRYVSNGFVHILNKSVFSTLKEHGQTSDLYYLTYFDITQPKKELEYFLLAVIFGICFLLAYAAVNRCSPVVFTIIVSAFAALPFVCNTFVGEGYLVCAGVCCILLSAMNFQGYSNSVSRRLFVGFGNTVKIRGQYVSYPAFQQAALLLIFTLAVVGISNAFYDFSNYSKSEKVDRFGQNLIYSVQNIASGNNASGLGGNSGSLNNGDLSKLGNLKYTGETMFEIKVSPSENSAPLYFRSFAAADYNGLKWTSVKTEEYKSYDFWKDFKNDVFYPQFLYGNVAASTKFSVDSTNISIIDKSINPKIFLTEYRMLPGETEVLSKASADYDNELSFDGFGGQDAYEESVILRNGISRNNIVVDPDSFDGSLYGLIHDGDFEYYDDIYVYDSSFDFPGSDSEEYQNLKEKEKNYRAFAAENYLGYPDGMDRYLPEDFDETVSNLFDSYLYNNNYTFTDEYGYEIDDYDDDSLSLDSYNYYYSAQQKFNAGVLPSYYDSVISYVKEYIQSKAEYTLSPGAAPSDRDFVEYFINQNHKGYCVHFATAGTLMLRRAGIPARYVEGYFVGESNLENSDEQGYSKIPDSNAHAWTEVYYPIIGWQVVDFTPYYSEEKLPDENRFSDSSEYENDTESDAESEIDTDFDSEDSSSDSDSDEDSEIIGSSDSSGSDTDEIQLPEQDGGLKSFFKVGLKVIVKALEILAVAAVITAVWGLIRFAFIRVRFLRFNSDDTRKSAGLIYLYSLRLLRLKGIRPDKGEGDREFAGRAMNSIEGIKTKEFESFTDSALNSRFGKNPPDKEEIDRMNSFVKKLSEKIYNSSGIFKRILIRYILFMDQ